MGRVWIDRKKLPFGQAAPSPSLDPIEAMSVMEEISENRKEQGRQTEKEKSGNGEKESNLMNQSWAREKDDGSCSLQL